MPRATMNGRLAPRADTGKEGAAYVLNTSRAHTHGKKAKAKITLPRLKFMEDKG